MEDAVGKVRDALQAVIEIYEDPDNPIPANIRQDPRTAPIWFESVIAHRWEDFERA